MCANTYIAIFVGKNLDTHWIDEVFDGCVFDSIDDAKKMIANGLGAVSVKIVCVMMYCKEVNSHIEDTGCAYLTDCWYAHCQIKTLNTIDNDI